MEYDKLLAPLERKGQHVAIGYAGQLPKGVIEFQRYLSSQIKMWTYRFFHDGTELIEALEKPDFIIADGFSHLLAILPDDMTLEPGEVNILAKRSKLRVLVLLGKALRSEEDRRRFFYIRGG